MEEGQRHSLPFTTQDIGLPDWTRTDAKIWIILNQFNRRNLSMYARSELALKLQPLWAEKARDNVRDAAVASNKARAQAPVYQNSDKPEPAHVVPEKVYQNSDKPIAQQPPAAPSHPKPIIVEQATAQINRAGPAAPTPTPEQPKPKPVIEPVNTLKEVAKAAGVSHDTIHKASIVAAKASESTKAKLRTGETTINREYKALVKDEKQREREERMFSNLKTSDPAGARGAGGGAAE